MRVFGDIEATDVLAFLSSARRRGSASELLEMEGTSFVLISDAKVARELLVDRSSCAEKRFGPASTSALASGVINATNSDHARRRLPLRRAMAEVHHVARDLALQYAAELVTELTKRSVLDPRRDFRMLTFRVIDQLLFGDYSIAARTDDLLPLLDDLEVLRSEQASAQLRGLSRRARRLRRAQSLMLATVDDAVRHPAGRQGVLLRRVVEEAHLQRQVHTLPSEVVTLLLTGWDTTAALLSWAVYLLTMASAEAEAVARTSPGDARRQRVRAVLAETLRLYPPAWLIARRMQHSSTVGGVSLGSGALCVICPYLLHRDPRLWPDAEEFRPSRWLTPNDVFSVAATRAPSGAWMPFGAGRRSCLGAEIALAESEAVLASIVTAFVFPEESALPELVLGTTLWPAARGIRVVPRSIAASPATTANVFHEAPGTSSTQPSSPR